MGLSNESRHIDVVDAVHIVTNSSLTATGDTSSRTGPLWTLDVHCYLLEFVRAGGMGKF